MCEHKGWPPVMDSDANQPGTSLYTGANGDAPGKPNFDQVPILSFFDHQQHRRLRRRESGNAGNPVLLGRILVAGAVRWSDAGKGDAGKGDAGNLQLYWGQWLSWTPTMTVYANMNSADLVLKHI